MTLPSLLCLSVYLSQSHDAMQFLMSDASLEISLTPDGDGDSLVLSYILERERWQGVSDWKLASRLLNMAESSCGEV